jgi:hypothetical protein
VKLILAKAQRNQTKQTIEEHRKWAKVISVHGVARFIEEPLASDGPERARVR